MSACDTCREPGHCCTFLHLSLNAEWTAWAGQSPLYALVAMAIYWLPFVPAAKAVEDGELMWSCPLVTAEGRCGDYENRPQLCRDYQPHEDHLCIEFIGPKRSQEREYDRSFRA